jgi:hypothetical protein
MKPMQHRDDALRFRADNVEAGSRIASEVDEILAKHGEGPRLRIILDGDALSTETIAALITGLRRMRERGGAIEVLPGSSALRDALLLTGLDHVFAFPMVPGETWSRRPVRRLGRMAKSTAAGFIAALAGASHRRLG